MTFSILTALQGVMQCHAVRGACAWCGPRRCDCSTSGTIACSHGLLLLQPLVLSDANMLIRVHDESFVLFFYNSFILLDKKPLMLVVAFLTGGQTVDTRYISIDISVARRPDDGHVHVQQDHQAVPCRQHSAVTTSVVATTFRNCCVMKLDIGNQNFKYLHSNSPATTISRQYPFITPHLLPASLIYLPRNPQFFITTLLSARTRDHSQFGKLLQLLASSYLLSTLCAKTLSALDPENLNFMQK